MSQVLAPVKLVTFSYSLQRASVYSVCRDIELKQLRNNSFQTM